MPNPKRIEVFGPGTSDDSVVEGNDLVYTVTLTESTKFPTEFTFQLGDASVLNGATTEDYGTATFSHGVTYDPATGMITVPAGVTSFSVTVPTTDDLRIEASETLPLTIDDLSATGIIVDNDVATPPTLLSLTRYKDGFEDGSSLPGWTLEISKPTTTDTVAMLSFRDSEDGTATYGADFNGWVNIYKLDGVSFLQRVFVGDADHVWNPGVITIPAGESGVKIFAETLEDTLIEGDETIKIWACVGGTALWSEEALIHDNDLLPPAPSLVSITRYADGNEDGTSSPGWTFTMSGASNKDTQAQLIFRTNGEGSTATFGSDYSGWINVYSLEGTFLQRVQAGNADQLWNPAVITIPAGATSVRLFAEVIDDTLIEGDEALKIWGAAGSTALWSEAAIIHDNEQAPSLVSITRFADGNEDGISLPGWTLTMSGTSSTDTQAQLAFRTNGEGSTATFGSDYSGWINVYSLEGAFLQRVHAGNADQLWSPGVITIPAGATGVRLYAEVVDNRMVESDETLKIWGAVGNKALWSEAAIIHDNDAPPPMTLLGSAKGTEDTPLTLTWSSLNTGDQGNALSGMTITSLPALGTLEVFSNGSWATAVTGQAVSKTEIDAGHFRFVPVTNQSGENEYLQSGTGNKLNDYAKFEFTVHNSSGLVLNGGTETIDIAPIAESINASLTTPDNAGNGPMIYYQLWSGTQSRYNGGAIWNEGYGYTVWTKLPLNLVPTADTDGSERIMVQISGVSHVTVGNTVIGLIGENSTYKAQNGSNWAVKGTEDYFKAADGTFWVNSSLISTVSVPSYTWYRTGTHFIAPNCEKFDGTQTINGFSVTITVHDQEINFAKTVLDEKTLTLGTKMLHESSSTPYHEQNGTPLVLDLNNDGVHTLDMAHGVNFDLLNQGVVKTGWVDKHDGLLALDLNHDGQINTGAELFGQATKLADGSIAKDGFEALAQYDNNADGKVDAQDAIFNQLKVWVDANSDGITQDGELQTLAQAGVASISLASQSSTATDNGNLLRLVGSYTDNSGAAHEIVDVWFLTSSTAAQSLDTLLANAGLSAAPVEPASQIAAASKAAEVFVEAKNMDANAWAVTHPELMA